MSVIYSIVAAGDSLSYALGPPAQRAFWQASGIAATEYDQWNDEYTVEQPRYALVHKETNRIWMNAAFPQWKLSNLSTQATTLDAFLPSSYSAGAGRPQRVPVLIVWIGRNLDTIDPAVFTASLKTYLQARRAAGWTVVLCTLISGDNTGMANYDTSYAAPANVTMRTWGPSDGVDALCDIGALSMFTPDGTHFNDTTYYEDGIHTTQLGGALIAAEISHTLATLLGVTFAVPENTVAPALNTTTPSVGDVVSCGNGTWSGSPVGYRYQWYRAGVAIGGQTASTHTVVEADAGVALTCKVTAINPKGYSSAAESDTATASAYVRTAFVSSTGDDGTAELNNPDLPYETLAAAVAELLAVHAEQSTTIRLLTDITESVSISDDLAMHGLTIRSHDATLRTLTGDVTFTGTTLDVILVNVEITSVVKPSILDWTQVSAGTITGDSTSIISTLNIQGASGVSGDSGTPGGSDTGSNGSQPPPNSPPDQGQAGGSATANGANATSGGGEGHPAWDITLAGTFTVTQLNGYGGAGGTGGSGGAGGSATGGNGSTGGDSNHPTDPEQGGKGGTGGAATANGGDGLGGGDGGDGSHVTKDAGVTITASNLAGGAAGSGGGGGAAGTATNGTPGMGGAGANGGAQGDPGDEGAETANAGNAGADGTAGANGSIS